MLAEVDVSATVGRGAAPVSYTLFGYTSSLAIVKLEGIGVNEEAHARSDGYYEFSNFYAPRNSNEFCLTAIDTEQRMGTPLCIIAPTDVQGKRFGPYLLAPTIQVANGSPRAGQTNTVTGKTIPGTNVVVNVFEVPDKLILTLIPPAYAQSQGKITITSRADGTFTTNILSDKPGKVRLFAQSMFKSQKTPKSNTLTITIFSLWLTFVAFVVSFIKSLITLNLIILLQILVLAYIIYRRFFVHHLYERKKRALALRKKNLPMIEPIRTLV